MAGFWNGFFYYYC